MPEVLEIAGVASPTTVRKAGVTFSRRSPCSRRVSSQMLGAFESRKAIIHV